MPWARRRRLALARKLAGSAVEPPCPGGPWCLACPGSGGCRRAWVCERLRFFRWADVCGVERGGARPAFLFFSRGLKLLCGTEKRADEGSRATKSESKKKKGRAKLASERCPWEN